MTDQKKRKMAEDALRIIAARRGIGVGEVREEIRKAILVGMSSQDPHAQA